MNVLIIYPHGNALNTNTGAGTRVWNIINTLIKHKNNVFILHSLNSIGNEDENLRKKCTVYYYRELTVFGRPDWYFTDLNPFFTFKLLKIIKKFSLNLIQIEFPWGFFIIKLFVPRNNLLIYDSHGVESKFIEVAIKNPNFPFLLKPVAKFIVKIYEKLVCKLTDFIINVSDLDREFYINNYKINRNKTRTIQISSSLTDINFSEKSKNKIKYREKLNLPLKKIIIVFHGTLPHPPNLEAFNFIENYISKKIIDSRVIFVLAGKNLKKYKKGNIISLGFVENLENLLISADIGIIPVISGSGMRVKCADYIKAGLPFITTLKGIEGINFLKDNEDCFISETVNEDFLHKLRILIENPDLRKKMHNNLLNKSYLLSSSKIGQDLIKLYKMLKVLKR